MHFLSLLSNKDSPLDFNLSARLPALLPHHSLDHEPSAFRKLTGTDTPVVLPELPVDPSASIDAIMEQRQRLINQFLQLNIQMLEKEILHQDIPHTDLPPPPKEQPSSPDTKALPKKIRKANHCGHEERPHYAKGMCSNCYHRHGRVKKPWNCPHEKLYAAGLCQNCYINDYNRKKREQGKGEDQKMEEKADPQEHTQTGVQCELPSCLPYPGGQS